MLTLKGRSAFAPERAHGQNGFIGHRAATMEIDSKRLEFLFHPSASNSKDRTSAG